MPRKVPTALHTALAGVEAESLAALADPISGRLLRPVQHDGAGADEADLVELVLRVAAIDASVGWLAAAFNSAARDLGELAPAAAADIWRTNPAALVTSANQVGGRLSRQLRLTGRWGPVVAGTFADWFLLPVGGPARPRLCLAPRGALDIAAPTGRGGLAAAGISEVAVTELALQDWHVIGGSMTVSRAATAAAVVGSAERMWRSHVERTRARMSGAQVSDELPEAVARHVARASSDIDAAKLQVLSSVDPRCDGTHAVFAQTQAAARARDAADRLLGSGRHALQAADPVTRHWRDVHEGYRLAMGSTPVSADPAAEG